MISLSIDENLSRRSLFATKDWLLESFSATLSCVSPYVSISTCIAMACSKMFRSSRIRFSIIEISALFSSVAETFCRLFNRSGLAGQTQT